ncbi:MAG TPA: sensor histidine kinase [Azonexus sp.]|nr:sensor histidine kinase [Azonexus sp.]
MPATARQRPLDLKRQLFARVSLFALVVLVLGTAAALLETRYRVRSDIQRTGLTIRQLITDEVNRNTVFSRTLSELNVDLTPLKPIGQLLSFCIEMTDIYSHVVDRRCFADPAPVPATLQELMRGVIGRDAVFQGSIGQYPGITVGQLTVTPNYGSEVLELAKRLCNLLAVSIMILFMSFFVYRPVRNALAPSAAILETLNRMQQGDLEARMPPFALIELNRIGAGFNDLADRLQSTIHSQQRLAHRLLSAREEERQHLARELHDEFGQYLASLNAEAAFARELADEGIPALRPCADAIGGTASHMMEALQQILHHLRPIGLEEFGLLRSLQQLIDGWNQRCRESTVFTLAADERLGDLPDDINVSIYRIVQESITNAVRHGRAANVAVTLQYSGAGLVLEIRDDGQGSPPPAQRSEPRKSGGFGLLGMEERVLALGGSLAIRPAANGGTVVGVRLPLASPGETPAAVRQGAPEEAHEISPERAQP